MIEEKFSTGSSLLHKADPKMKIIGFMLPALVVACSSSLSALYAGLASAILLALFARLHIIDVCKQLAAINFFILFLWLILPISGSSDILTHIGPIPIYAQGLALAHRITIKANTITLFILSLLATSSVLNIGRGLEQLGLSKKLTLLLVSSFRYLEVIHQEYLRLHRAAVLRCFKPGTNTHTYRTFSYLIGMTLIRSYQQAGRIQKAMIMRGFNGTFPSLNAAAAKPFDYILSALLICLGLFLAVISWK